MRKATKNIFQQDKRRKADEPQKGELRVLNLGFEDEKAEVYCPIHKWIPAITAVSHSEKNSGKEYYYCPFKDGTKGHEYSTNFLSWAGDDETISGSKRPPPNFGSPPVNSHSDEEELDRLTLKVQQIKYELEALELRIENLKSMNNGGGGTSTA